MEKKPTKHSKGSKEPQQKLLPFAISEANCFVCNVNCVWCDIVGQGLMVLQGWKEIKMYHQFVGWRWCHQQQVEIVEVAYENCKQNTDY